MSWRIKSKRIEFISLVIILRIKYRWGIIVYQTVHVLLLVSFIIGFYWLQVECGASRNFADIAGNRVVMAKPHPTIQMSATSELMVLIRSEPTTGKELVAPAHAMSLSTGAASPAADPAVLWQQGGSLHGK